MEKIKEFFSKKWVIVVLILIVTVGIIKVFLGFIYVKDEPKFIPEEIREEVRGGIKENIAEPLAEVIPSLGNPFVEAAYSEPVPNQDAPVDTDTTTWKTYRSEEFGFELKHPEEWAALKGDENVISFFPEGEETEGVTLYVYRGQASVQGWWDRDIEIYLGEDIKPTQSIIGNKEFYIFKQSDGLQEVHYVTLLNGTIYDFMPIGFGHEKIEKIINTFN